MFQRKQYAVGNHCAQFELRLSEWQTKLADFYWLQI